MTLAPWVSGTGGELSGCTAAGGSPRVRAMARASVS